MDINVTDGTILETLNNKADIDGGNYVGSGLEQSVKDTLETKVNKSGDSMTGTLNLTGMSDGYCQQRLVSSNYGVMFRNDNANFYMLLTNSGNPYGNWNDLRPFSLNLSTGVITTTASATTNSIVTTAGIKKASSGYVKLGNGIIIQWGITSTLSAKAEATVTLPIAFTSTNYKVTGSANYSETKYATVGVHTLTTTSFKLLNITNVSSSCPFHWIAVGY